MSNSRSKSKAKSPNTSKTPRGSGAGPNPDQDNTTFPDATTDIQEEPVSLAEEIAVEIDQLREQTNDHSVPKVKDEIHIAQLQRMSAEDPYLCQLCSGIKLSMSYNACREALSP